jgi:hypothetical protein
VETKIIVDIGSDGEVRCLATCPLVEQIGRDGVLSTRRASHVEPINGLLRRLFHAIRRRVSDKSRLAAWTRRWPCLWRVDLALSGGPILGPFTDRNSAINAEIDWLSRNNLGKMKCD